MATIHLVGRADAGGLNSAKIAHPCRCTPRPQADAASNGFVDCAIRRFSEAIRARVAK